MATTDASDQPKTPALKNFDDLKLFIDVQWAIPKVKVQEILNEKAGKEGFIDLDIWRLALKYAHNRDQAMQSEITILRVQVEEMNSAHGSPYVTVTWPKWMQDELDSVYNLAQDMSIGSIQKADESLCRHYLVVIVVVQLGLREAFAQMVRKAMLVRLRLQIMWEKYDVEAGVSSHVNVVASCSLGHPG